MKTMPKYDNAIVIVADLQIGHPRLAPIRMDSTTLRQFQHLKKQCLDKEDFSRKGSIDEPIRELVGLINASEFYYTTSTCSGRISLIEKPQENAAIKRFCNFLSNCHEELNFDQLHDIVKTFAERAGEDTCLWLKYEPFILHVRCFDLDKAHSFLRFAIAQGCRNSGITLGKNGKYLVAVRSTSSMELPLCCGDRFKMDEPYVRFLSEECNRRLRENLSKLKKFTLEVGSILL